MRWYGVLILIAIDVSATLAVLDTENETSETGSSTVCLYHSSKKARVNNEGSQDLDVVLHSDNPYQKCTSEHNCFTFWEEDPVNGNFTILAQGCWVSSESSHDCESTQCVSTRRPAKAMNATTRFCCCSGSKCNENFTVGNVVVQSTEMPPPVLKQTPVISTLLLICLSLFVIFTASSVLVLIRLYVHYSPKKDDVEMGGGATTPSPDLMLCKLKLANVIGQGRYGCVWKGTIDDQEVAVKIFPAHNRNYYLNERDLYEAAGEHVALLKCYGGGERSIVLGGPVDYLLILNLERECLQEYLKAHTVDFPTLCKMGLGVASGLAHLHSDLGKSCLAHRDFNTRNILVRTDLTCCICDLGLAVIPRNTENRSLSEAGTLRYMAPEVLEGAVNLRDCESALKQIDVYSLGLVMWELGSRCTDMQAAEPQPYAPPYYNEVGDHPTLEQMQCLVSRHKARPLWPASWKDTAAARLLCETAEDCWDQDAEARLTSLCVEERFLELPTLRGRVLHPMHPPSSPTPLINNNHIHDHNIDASVGTVETLLSLSEENCKNSNQHAICITPLQPYQGRNPCLERNLLSGSTDSLLIDKSSKHCTNYESQNLVTNDYLNFQVNHRAMPIPYVQNAVHANNQGAPKEFNVPKSKFKWGGFKKIFQMKKDSGGKSHKDTQVRIVPASKLVNSFGQNGVTTSLLNEKRPTTLPLPLPPVQADANNKCNSSGVTQLLMRRDSLNRQRSLEQFSEVFSSTSDLSRLKDPSQRVKTPGDVPPSVRRTRGRAAKESAARFSLYDDRMMTQWGSAPDLEPNTVPPRPPQLNDLQDRDSGISSEPQ